MSKDNGGPAFPLPLTEQDGTDWNRCGGMSIRDYFAAKALEGDWASQGPDTGEFDNGCPLELLEKRAALYYRMADAMLKERAK